ncbi:MAG: RNA polymerase sigma factor [Nitrospiria bacterium]
MKNTKDADLDRFLAQVERRAFIIAHIATRDTEEALDLVQDAMLALAHQYRRRDASEWGPLFHRILQNKIRDWQRRSWIRNRWRAWLPQKKADGERTNPTTVEDMADRRAGKPDDHLAAKNTQTALENALHRLPLRQRQAFLLRAWEGLNVSDTARAMGCSAGSVKTHFSRAVHALRKHLKGHHG